MDQQRESGEAGPAAAGVRVWTVCPEAVRDAALLGAYEGLLDPAERLRYDRFRQAAARRRYLVSRALVRCALSREAGLAPADWRFVAGAHGRPEVRPGLSPLPLRFNLSHTAELAACAVTLAHDVGVDVEWLHRPDPAPELARRYLSGAEWDALRALPAARRRLRFFEIWTLKEAYIKARGLGLALALERFSLDAADPQRVRIAFAAGLDDDPSAWQFALLRPGEAHVLALAVRRGAGADLPLRIAPMLPLAAD